MYVEKKIWASIGTPMAIVLVVGHLFSEFSYGRKGSLGKSGDWRLIFLLVGLQAVLEARERDALTKEFTL